MKINDDQVLVKRKKQLRWLKENHPEVFLEQKHLENGTPERAYWHYGYAAALGDLLFMADQGMWKLT